MWHLTRERGISLALPITVKIKPSYIYWAQSIQFNKYILHNNYGKNSMKLNNSDYKEVIKCYACKKLSILYWRWQMYKYLQIAIFCIMFGFYSFFSSVWIGLVGYYSVSADRSPVDSILCLISTKFIGRPMSGSPPL